ncbi:MAG: hypothetical protein JW760_11095 [Spirochaetales bacterium]|nr:hypothetical protein [Spirochaetales bacterium]
MEDPENSSLLKPLQVEAGELLYRSRHSVLDRFADTSLQRCDKETLLAFCDAVLDRQQRIAIITLDPLLYVNSLSIEADTFRLQEDLQRIFASFVSMKGITCLTDSGSVLLLFETSQKMDTDLLYHHIVSTISGFFTEPPQTIKNFCSLVLCPEDVQNPSDALNGLFTD